MQMGNLKFRLKEKETHFAEGKILFKIYLK